MKTFSEYIYNNNKNMVKSILKGENLKRVFFAFLKDNNAFYNYMDAFYNFHCLMCKEFTANPSFDYFFDFCSYKDDPTALIYNAFNWADTKEGHSYWSSLFNKFVLLCNKLKKEESKKDIEETKKILKK